MKIRVYKTNIGLLLGTPLSQGCYSSMSIVGYRYNGQEAIQSQSKDWIIVPQETELESVEKLVKGSKVNFRYNLRDLNMESEVFPRTLTRDDVGYKDDGYDEWTEEKYKHHRSLYEEVWDIAEDTWTPEEFEVEHLGEVEITDVENPYKMTYKIAAKGYNHPERHIDLSEICSYSGLDKILVPSFAMNERPCKLSSRNTYAIIRSYVKDNIDPKLARVTSDYLFCFAVKKKIGIKPWIRITEEKKSNGKSYAKPKITKTKVESKMLEVFEMTDSDHKYGGHTVIKGFEGESLTDLAENVKLYLDELMEVINSEVHECAPCEGTGHIINKRFDKNDR